MSIFNYYLVRSVGRRIEFIRKLSFFFFFYCLEISEKNNFQARLKKKQTTEGGRNFYLLTKCFYFQNKVLIRF